jgi:hypothetical protein
LLKQLEPEHDFLKGSPVIIDIIQPNNPKLQRILAVVESLDEDSSNIVVHKNASDIGGLYEGARFNMYIQLRDNEEKWTVVQLKIINENYEDGLDLSNPNQATPVKSHRSNIASRKVAYINSFQEVYSSPIPSNYTETGEPYFAPPVNLPPLPIGYNECHIPFYGKTPSVKPHPAGINLIGVRYYGENQKSKDPNYKNVLAGYDADGIPFYIPKGFIIPPPSGFSLDGVPYYDIPSLIRQQGFFSLPGMLRGEYREAKENDKWEDLLILLQNPNEENILLHRRIEHSFLSRLIGSVYNSLPGLAKKMTSSKNRLINPFQNKFGNAKSGIFLPSDDFVTVRDPIDVAKFLRDSLSFLHLRPQPIKISLEPNSCDFHSARAPMSKVLSLRYKAGRGDYTEREFFIAVEPPNIFWVKDNRFKLQGEGIIEIQVTYYPLAMKTKSEEGSIFVFDAYGRKMSSSKLNAVRRKFINIHNTVLDLGWALPGKKKEGAVVIENLADYPITVVVQPPKTNISDSNGTPKASAFSSPMETLKLKAAETSKIPVYFAPKVLSNSVDTMKIFGPGGEEIIIQLIGSTDIPMAVFSENQQCSKLGVDVLSIERSQLVRKLEGCKEAEQKEAITSKLSTKEREILKSITAERNTPDEIIPAHTLDFGILVQDGQPSIRCLTIFNWGSNPIICGLYTHEKSISLPNLVRVAPRSASSIEVIFDVNNIKKSIKGNFSSIIELSCQDFENIPLLVKAFVGQPLYVPTWKFVFFKTCRLGQTVCLTTGIVNESHYKIKFKIEGLSKSRNSGFHCNEFLSDDMEMEIPEFSFAPILLSYTPEITGPVSTCISFHMKSPNEQIFPAALNNQHLYLIGIAIQPRIINEDKVHPAFETLMKWLNQCRNQGFIDPINFDFSDTNDDFFECNADLLSDVVFKSDPYIPEIAGDFSTRVAPLSVQNRGSSTKKTKFISSLSFAIDPKSKGLEPGELLKLDSLFSAPNEPGNKGIIYGFATAIDSSNYVSSSTQIVKRLSLAFLVLPFQNYVDQQLEFDFGIIELDGYCNNKGTRFLFLCNPFTQKYRWSIKIAPSARKTQVFQIPYQKGELSNLDTFAIPITFATDVSGTYETKCDVYVDSQDQLNKSIRVGSFLLRGTAAYSKVYGFPDIIEFGSAIIYTYSKRRFTIQNEGSREVEIVSLVRAPFSMKPSKCSIPAKSSQIIEFIFNPVEHRSVNSMVQIFMNQSLHIINVSGTGGSAVLSCNEYENSPIDFGLQKDGDIAWTSIFLTNNGSIPLRIAYLISDQPKKIRAEFLGVVKSIPSTEQKIVNIN